MIKENSVVSMTYVLKDENRIILDASIGRPFVLLQGHKNIIPGLEKQLVGLKEGDKKNLVVSPDEGYGQYDPNLRMTIPRQQFGEQTPDRGRQVQLQSPNGQPFVATIVDVKDDQVFLDANHPLAGKTLHFEVDILEIRDATEEEIAHGHPHMPGEPHA